MAIVYRLVKGSRLTKAEGDGNFADLDGRLTAVETALPDAAREIDTIERIGSNLLITFSDLTTTLVPIPALSVNFRGTWAPSTSYAVNDFFTANGAVYVVLIDHVSALTFDPGATETSGNLYAELLANPAAAFPTGGSTGMVLAKQTSADYDVEWIFLTLAGLTDVDIATDLADGDHLVFRSGAWVNEAFSLPEPTSGTGATLGGVFAEPGVANSWIYGIDTDGTPLLSQPAFSNISGTVADSQLLQIKKQTVASIGGSLTLDRSLGEICTLTLTQNITSISVTNWPTSGFLGRIVLYVTNPASFTMTGYPSSTASDVEWVDGVEPIPTPGGRDKYMLSTWDNGANIDGDVIGQDYS